MDGGKVDDDSPPRGGINDGDWICPDSQCGNVNFARRNSCNRCGKDRGECPKKKKLGQEIGKVAAEKSRGLFSADDWQCSKCGNVNWARRQQCNMCNAPKFGEVEERTGYGGGYNDRGIVEYKERREEEDDEYDEFGRRKKRRKMENRSDDDSKDSRYSSPPRSKFKDIDEKIPTIELSEPRHEAIENNAREAEEDEDEEEEEEKEEKDENDDDGGDDDDDGGEEEEEEEEEEDDDGDLSKYDLSEWDDFVPAKKGTNGSTTSAESQRSRNGDKWRGSGTSSQ